MASSVDGDLRLVVDFDTSGAQKSVKSLSEAIKGVANASADALSAGAKGAERFSAKIAKSAEALQKQEAKIEDLQRKYDALLTGEVKAPSVKKMETELGKAQKELEKTENAYTALEERMLKLKSSSAMQEGLHGFATKSTLTDIQATEKELDALGFKMADLDDLVKGYNDRLKEAHLSPASTDEAAKLADQLAIARQTAGRLREENDNARQAAMEYAKAVEEDVVRAQEKAEDEQERATKNTIASLQRTQKELATTEAKYKAAQESFAALSKVVLDENGALREDASPEAVQRFTDISREVDALKDRVASLNVESGRLHEALALVGISPTAISSAKEYKNDLMLAAKEAARLGVNTPEIGEPMEGAAAEAKKLADSAKGAANSIESLGESTGSRFLDRIKTAATNASSALINIGKTAAKSIGSKIAEYANRGASALLHLGKSTNKSSNSFERMVASIHNAINRLKNLAMAALVFNVIRRGLRTVQEYMSGLLKANSQFSRSLQQVQYNLKVAFTPIYQAVLPALNALMSALAKVTAHIAAFISVIFGRSLSATQDATKTLEKNAKAIGSTGGAAKKSEKELEKYLASFDEIQTIGSKPAEDSSGGGGGGSTALPELGEVDTSWIDRLLLKLQPTIDAMKRLWTAMEPFRSFVWQGLVDFYGHALKPIGDWALGVGLPTFADILGKFFQNVNWQGINDALVTLWNALTPFAINVGEGLLWFLDNVLRPIAEFVIGEALPLFLEIFAAAIGVINGILAVLTPIAVEFYERFLVPLGEWTGGAVVTVLEFLRDALLTITDALHGFADWITGNQETLSVFEAVMGGIAIAVGLLVAGFLLYNVVMGIAAIVTTAFSVAMAILTSPITLIVLAIAAVVAVVALLIANWDKVKEVAINVWNSIKDAWKAAADWFDTNVVKPVGEFFTTLFTNIGDWAKNAWQSIKDAFNNAKTWFKTTVIDPVSNAFSGLWDGIKGFATSAWDSITSGAKAMVNGVIDFVNNLINKAVGGVNNIIDGINSLIGFTGINIGRVTAPQIPHLASGAVIPPNDEFLAVLGDNKKEQEIVAPESTLRSIIRDELDSLLGDFPGNRGPTTVQLMIDRQVLGSVVVDLGNDEQNRRGVRLVPQV